MFPSVATCVLAITRPSHQLRLSTRRPARTESAQSTLRLAMWNTQTPASKLLGCGPDRGCVWIHACPFGDCCLDHTWSDCHSL